MPELAEVETVKNVLIDQIVGKKITNIDIKYLNIFENSEAAKKLIGQTFIDIKRRGKYLIFVLDKGFLLSHLRMEGKYFYQRKDELVSNKHMHVYIYLDNEYVLIYQDVRKFGRMHYYDNYEDLLLDLKLGLDANVAINDIDNLYNILKTKKVAIKQLLLDQSFIAGLGNIYVDEVLYYAHILPNKPANLVTYDEFKLILEGSKVILDKAILEKGTTIRTYTSSLGVYGNYQNFLKVHTKEECPLGHKILKMKVSGRTSYYCPICQMPKINRKIGITGSIASGKSNISATLRKMGFKVLDSDELVKEAYFDDEIIKKVKEKFPTVFSNDVVDKTKLAQIIFDDSLARKELNNIIHPYVIARLKGESNEQEIVFLDIPLLFEADLKYLVDDVICCYLPKDLEVSRLINRDNISYDYALKKINSQIDLELKKEWSNYIIDTSGSFLQTNENLIEVLEAIYSGIYI